MTELKAAFEGCGLEDVVTYINSGNVAFDVGSDGGECQLVSMIEQAIETSFGKQVPVMVCEQAAINEILAKNPFEGEFENHKEMRVLFLREEMPSDKIEQLLAVAPEGERFAVVDREIYCHLLLGVADSLLGKSFIEKKLKVAVTGRNWRTVQKLAEL